MTVTAGYSGRPLAAKLGMQPGFEVCTLDAPAGYDALIAPWPDRIRRVARPTAETDLVHLFVERRQVLDAHLAALRELLKPAAALWVSWPKKASKRPTDITEDRIRDAALPLGFVDVKVCAVDEVWSGLKLVVRRALR